MESQALASTIPIFCFSKSALAHASRPPSCCFSMLSGAPITWRKLGMLNSTRASSSTVDTLVQTNNQISPTNPISKIGSPLLWIAVGVGLSAWFSVMVTKFKRYAINKAFKAVMGEEAETNGEFNNSAFGSGSPFPSLPSQTAEASGDIYIDEHNVNIWPADNVINDEN